MSRIRLIAAVLIAGSLAVVEFRSLAQSTSQHQPGSGLVAQGSGQEAPVSPSVERAVAAPAPPWARPLAEGEMESPTGRRPKAIWTGARQAVWNNRINFGDRDWANALRSAGASGSSKQRYADLGQWATVAYQATGDPSYAEKAWRRIERKIGKHPPNRNFTREHLVEYAWMYDWLKPALSEERRRQYIDMMNSWCLLTLNRVPGKPWGTRTGDSDETVGHYFGLALWAAVSGEENPQAAGWLNESLVGGFQSTGANRKSWRNAISQYVRNAKGGVWMESSKYNMGTLRLLFFGAEAIRTATGRDDFPEITALAGDAATAQLHELTSDLKQSYQWGDVEGPRDLHLQRRCPLLAMLTGLVADDRIAGQTLALLESLPWKEIGPRELPLYNPRRAAYDWRTQPLAYAAEGMGLVFGRSGWDPGAAFFGAHMPSRIGADHEVHYFGDFQMYRGEWVVTHPLGYGVTDGQYVNGMLLGGWPSMWEARGLVEHGMTDDGIVVAVGSTAGSPYGEGYLAPPATFCHEWTRSVVFVPDRAGRADLLIVHDRTLMENPMKLSGFDRYHKRDRTRMEREIPLGLRQWLVHMPVRPQVQDRSIRWTTPGGQPVQVTTLLPERVTHRVLDERTDVHMGKHVPDSEKGWQVRVVPLDEPEWQTLLHVIQVGEGPVQVRVVREGEWEGLTIAREGMADRTVLFNAAPGSKLPRPKFPVAKLKRDRTLLKRFQGRHVVQVR